MVRIPLTAADSLAAIRARNRLGMAMAARMRIIATTINSSISEKPRCLLFIVNPPPQGSIPTQVSETGITNADQTYCPPGLAAESRHASPVQAVTAILHLFLIRRLIVETESCRDGPADILA